MLLVLCHEEKITIRNNVNDLGVCQMQSVHKGGYLPEERVVAYGFGFAVSLWTLDDKVDSL